MVTGLEYDNHKLLEALTQNTKVIAEQLIKFNTYMENINDNINIMNRNIFEIENLLRNRL